MRTVTVADAKARLSAVLAAVEAGEQIIITRHGRAVARIVPERPTSADSKAWMNDLWAFVAAQPMYEGDSVAEMRELERY